MAAAITTDSLNVMKTLMKLSLLATSLALAGCVNVDPETGKTLPRGGQKHEFAIVEQRAAQLQNGLSKPEVVILLGSPAETSNDGNTWVYLPERPAVLIPSHALRLVFKDNTLVSHESVPIILGKTL
jgi:outer membrane protein assembly factor BamE (lipoprotein component of BamABCDE complex)